MPYSIGHRGAVESSIGYLAGRCPTGRKRADDGGRRSLLNRHGYALDDDCSSVMLCRSLVEPLGVDPDFIRRGLGRLLLNELLRRFQRNRR